MNRPRLRILFSILALFILGCSRSSSREKVMNPKPSVSQDIDTLGKLIQLPQRPLSVQWSVRTLGDGVLGPQDESLTVLLRYPPKTAADLLAACPASSEVASNPSIPLEDWFPKELKQGAGKDGKTVIIPAGARSPVVFARSPYLRGFVAAVPGTDLLLLHLFTL